MLWTLLLAVGLSREDGSEWMGRLLQHLVVCSRESWCEIAAVSFARIVDAGRTRRLATSEMGPRERVRVHAEWVLLLLVS